VREGAVGEGVRNSGRSDLPPLARELLGVSHLVLSLRDPAASRSVLDALGYTEHGANDRCPNPREKAPFLAGPLSETCSMGLMVPANGSPAIEVLASAEGAALQTHFEVVLSEQPGAEVEDIRAEREVVVPGLARPRGREGKLGTGALLIHVDDLDAALRLWRVLGYADEPFADRTRKVAVRGLRASNRLDLYFVADRDKSEEGRLDAVGIVCLSLFCRDADRLRDALQERGYAVGECFTLAPFGTALRVFFMRNETGEIYEFLSVERARKAGSGS